MTTKTTIDKECAGACQGIRSDIEIQRGVFTELVSDHRVDPTEVAVEVHAGIVTLTGTVNSYGKKAAAGEAALRGRGVVDVVNDIVARVALEWVTPFRPHDPSYPDIEQRIREALSRRAERAARRIRVSIKGGCVTLWGTVRSEEEHDAILGVVRHAPGVRQVEDELVCTLLPVVEEHPTPVGWRNR